MALILQHVPQQERLSSCALVCSNWAAAAALATTHVRTNRVSAERRMISAAKPEHRVLAAEKLAALGSWLSKHAKQMVELNVAPFSLVTLHQHKEQPRPQLLLPAADLVQLTQLHLSGCHPRLTWCDSSRGPAQAEAQGACTVGAPASCISSSSSLKQSAAAGACSSVLLPKLQTTKDSPCQLGDALKCRDTGLTLWVWIKSALKLAMACHPPKTASSA